MREVAFIKNNKKKWLEIQALLNVESPSAEQLNQAFDTLNNDLAFSQTYYPKSKLVEYLNALSQQVYNKIYRPKKDWMGIGTLFTKEVPLIMYRFRKLQYFSMAFFIFCALLGVLSMENDENFARTILGDYYVNKTIENIENGDPTAVYNNDSNFQDAESAFIITLNNLWVGLQNFFYGLILGIGSLYIMFKNGIMVGVFLKMFDHYNVFWESMRSIFIHGAMELFSITVEGAAGMLLGFSYLFPGSLSRKQSFFLKGKQAMKMVISTFPFTISAGILEGFVTQYGDDFPLFVSLFIIFGTFSFIFYYYLIYPFRVAKKYDWERYQFAEWIQQYD